MHPQLYRECQNLAINPDEIYLLNWEESEQVQWCPYPDSSISLYVAEAIADELEAKTHELRIVRSRMAEIERLERLQFLYDQTHSKGWRGL